MPVHDWTRVDASLFHAFHQHWIVDLYDALNSSGLPPAYFALIEPPVWRPVPDVLTLQLSPDGDLPSGTAPAVSVADAPPRAQVVRTTEADIYVRKADRITVRHRHGQVVAVVEIVSPGNKGSQSALRAFVEKIADLIQQGIHVLIIDLFPPTRRDPHGLHKAIWDEFEDEDFTLPADTPLILASYSAGPVKTAYVEPITVRAALPDMPLFLAPELYVPVPLEATYQTAWKVFPAPLKRLLEPDSPSTNAGILDEHTL